MKAIVVTDQAAGTAGLKLVERPEPQAAINDVVVQVHASGFTSGELTWPSTWTDRLDRDRTPSIPGQELAGVVTALGYGTTGLSVGQRVFGLSDSYRGGTVAEYVAVEVRNLAPLPGDVDFTVGASVAMPGLTAWQGRFEHGRLQAGQTILVHGAAGAVGSMVTQLAREAGACVIGTGRAADRQKALDFGAQEFVDLDNDTLEDVGPVALAFDVIGGDIAKRSAGVIRAGGTAGDHRRPDRSAGRRRPDDRLCSRVRSRPTGRNHPAEPLRRASFLVRLSSQEMWLKGGKTLSCSQRKRRL
jgi:NADPH:quinone reductase-like Zn-dependent oxidoreductase